MPEFETDEERSYFIARLYVHELFTGEGVAHEEEMSLTRRKGTPRNWMILSEPKYGGMRR